MPVLTSDGKQVEKRYTADGKNVRTVYNANGDIVFEEIDTAEGTLPQSFKSKGKPLVNYRIFGNTVQDGTPTPENPVEVQGCGIETENLNPLSKVPGNNDGRAYVIRNLFLKKGTYYLWTTEDNGLYSGTIGVYISKNGGTYTREGSNTGTSISKAITLEDNATINAYVYNRNITDTMTFTSTLTTEPLTKHIPYGYKLDITTNGVNLFDSTTVLKGVFLRAHLTEASSVYGEYNKGANWNSSDFIKVSPNTSYTVTYPTIKEALVAGIVFYSEHTNDSAFGGISIDDQGVVLKYTFTTPANCNYVRFSYPNTKGNNCTFTNVPLTTPVYIGQSPIYKIGDYADYKDYKRGGVMRRIKELVLTGEENWIFASAVYNGANTTSRYILTGLQDIRENTISLCSVASYRMGVWGYDVAGQCTNAGFQVHLRLPNLILGITSEDTDIQRTEKFKSFLAEQYAAGTPVKIYYVLATPEFEPVSDLAKIPTFAPQTVIDADMTIKPSKMWCKYKP